MQSATSFVFSSNHNFLTPNLFNDDCLEISVQVPLRFLYICQRTESSILSSYNKFAQITARALRASLKEEERVVAEKRGLTTVRYQKWEGGVGGQQVRISPHRMSTKSHQCHKPGSPERGQAVIIELDTRSKFGM